MGRLHGSYVRFYGNENASLKVSPTGTFIKSFVKSVLAHSQAKVNCQKNQQICLY